MPTATPPPPPINAKRSRRHGLVNPPKPDVPPSPPLPPIPPRSPLRARARSSVDASVVGLLPPADISSPPSSSSATPIPPSAPLTPLNPSYFDIAMSSSPLSTPSSASELPSSHLPGSVSAPALAHASTPSSSSTPSMSKRTHALRELLSSERAYASDLSLIRDVYIHLARDPMAPFSAATPPSQPPVTKNSSSKPRMRSSTSTSASRPKTASSIPSTPPISPSPSMQSTRTASSSTGHTSFMPSMKRKTSSPALRRAASGSVTTSPQQRHKQPLSEEDIRLIFLNLEKLAALSYDFCASLDNAIGGAGDDEGDGLGFVMLHFLPRMVPLYKVYIAKHPAAAQHLAAITPAITPYLTTARALTNPHTNAWDLPSLLIKPVQRFLKYPLLLAAIIDATPGEAPGSIQLREAHRVAEKACVDINDAKRVWEEVGSVLRNARNRKLAVPQSALPSRASLPPSLEAWDRQLEQREKLIRKYLIECREWSRSINRTFLALVEWAEANERIMKIGMKEGETDDGRGRWCRSVVEEIQRTTQRMLDARIQGQLAPILNSLLGALSSPRLLITALRTHLPPSVAEPVQTQLSDELPKLNRLADVMLARCVVMFARWQGDFWEGVRTQWGSALGEEPGEWLRGFEDRVSSGVASPTPEQLSELHRGFTSPHQEVISLDDPLIVSRRRPKDAAELTAQLYGLPIAGSEDFEDPDATYVQHVVTSLPPEHTYGDIPADPSSGFYGLASAQSSSSVLLPSFNSGIEMSRSTPSLTKDDTEGLLPSLPSSEAPSEARDESLAFMSDAVTLQDGLKGLPLDEALRSLGMQELNLNDDVQGEWEEVYAQRLSQSTDSYYTPPNTMENESVQESPPNSAKAKGMRRLRSSASARSLSKMFSRSRSATPEVQSTPPPPLPVPWASSYSYSLPSTQTEEAELAHYRFYTQTQPQQMFSPQPSAKDKVLAFRQHSRVSSSPDSSPSNDPESRRSSANDHSVPPSSFTPPPKPRSAHFTVSPITAFHLPSPRYHRYTFHGLPFLTLRVGDLITVTQDAGRPTDYRDFPLWTDGREDRLLVGKTEDGNEGWLLASFVIPVS